MKKGGGISSRNDIAAIVEEVQRLRRPRLGEVSAKSVHM